MAERLDLEPVSACAAVAPDEGSAPIARREEQMTIDGFEQFSTAIGLSRQKDGVSLTRCLIDQLHNQLSGSHVCVMEVYGHSTPGAQKKQLTAADVTIKRFDDASERVASGSAIDPLMPAIQSLQPSVVASEQYDTDRLIIPIPGEIGPLRLVVVDGVPLDPLLRAKSLQIVEIYSNLIRLMDSRERDALTGLLNRQTFTSLFEMASRRAAGLENGMLTLAVLDIDHFKRINDNYGHLYGDEVLLQFARLMDRTFRYTDDLFRFGGEEFIVLLETAAGPDAPSNALERFRKAVEAHVFPGGQRVTVSIGYVACSPGILPTTLVDHADRALYAAKQQGRNCALDYASVDKSEGGESGEVDLF